MGGKLSGSESPIGEQERAVEGPALSGSVNGLNHRHHHRHHHHYHHHRLSHQTSPAGGSSGSGGGSGGGRSRTRSHGGFSHHRNHGSPSAEVPDTDRSPLGDVNGSPVLERPRSRSLVTAGTQGALPLHLFSFHGLKCPVCTKIVPPDDIECHLVMCFTKPRVIYNEDVLKEDKGECVICLDELCQGDTIARLPCLCVYHKRKPFLIITTNARSRDSERFEHAQINPIDHFRTQQEQSERINERLSGRSDCSERSEGTR